MGCCVPTSKSARKALFHSLEVRSFFWIGERWIDWTTYWLLGSRREKTRWRNLRVWSKRFRIAVYGGFVLFLHNRGETSCWVNNFAHCICNHWSSSMLRGKMATTYSSWSHKGPAVYCHLPWYIQEIGKALLKGCGFCKPFHQKFN